MKWHNLVESQPGGGSAAITCGCLIGRDHSRTERVPVTVKRTDPDGAVVEFKGEFDAETGLVYVAPFTTESA